MLDLYLTLQKRTQMRMSLLLAFLSSLAVPAKSGELPDIIQEMIDREREDDKKFLGASKKIIQKVQKQRKMHHLPPLPNRSFISSDDAADDVD